MNTEKITINEFLKTLSPKDQKRYEYSVIDNIDRTGDWYPFQSAMLLDYNTRGIEPELGQTEYIHKRQKFNWKKLKYEPIEVKEYYTTRLYPVKELEEMFVQYKAFAFKAGNLRGLYHWIKYIK